MSENLLKFIAKYKADVEEALLKNLPLSTQLYTEEYNEAVKYAVFPGGKRWRPMMTLIAAMIVGGRPQDALPSAVAMEYLHSSSLILDDLPAMDNAEFRRGLPTLHLVFGESTAVLVSLALMNRSYESLLEAGQRSEQSNSATRLLFEAVSQVGANGMIGGQITDLMCRKTRPGMAGLLSRNLKTTALTKLMMMAGAIPAGATEDQLKALIKYGECFGAAYQICDDLLDELAGSELTGKPGRQDQRHSRSSFVSELGIDKAYQMADELMVEAVNTIRTQFGNNQGVELLTDATDLILNKLNIGDSIAEMVA